MQLRVHYRTDEIRVVSQLLGSVVWVCSIFNVIITKYKRKGASDIMFTRLSETEKVSNIVSCY